MNSHFATRVNSQTGIPASLEEFWTHFRTAFGDLLSHPLADCPRVTAPDLAAYLRGTTSWLDARSVKGFREEDFVFLALDERDVLSVATQQYLEVVVKIAPHDTPTAAQVDAARPAFQRIAEILRPDLHADAEALVIGKTIDRELKGQLPNSIVEIRYETGIDASGGDALWIWVVLEDNATADKQHYFREAQSIREMLTERATELRTSRWPYVRFRTESELAASS